MALSRSHFDHIGVITDEKHPGESFVEATRVWVTSPRDHPANIEWLRYDADSPVRGPVRDQSHVAYRVSDLEAAIKGHEVLLPPFDVGNGFVQVAFVLSEGAVVEFMQYRNPHEDSWF